MKDLYRSQENNSSEINEEIYWKIYKSLGLLGGPTYPLDEIPVTYTELYNKVKYFMENNLSDRLLCRDDDNKLIFTCDDIFALFLIEVSKIFTEKFYKTIVIFIKSYRDCLNKVGWEILQQYKSLDKEPTHLEFTSVKSGDFIPDVCNDFLNIYLPSHLPSFDKYFAIVLINHFCDWIYKFNFTKIKIKYIDNK